MGYVKLFLKIIDKIDITRDAPISTVITKIKATVIFLRYITPCHNELLEVIHIAPFCNLKKSIDFQLQNHLNFKFLAHLSFSDYMSSVCPSFLSFYIFIFFLKNNEPISNKLSTKHPRVKGIYVCVNEGPHLTNNEIVKIHWRKIKIFFSRTTGPISTKHNTMHSWVMGI